MCVVCTDWIKGKMTSQEALRALGEMINSNDKKDGKNSHYFEVVDKIMEKEVPFKDLTGTD